MRGKEKWVTGVAGAEEHGTGATQRLKDMFRSNGGAEGGRGRGGRIAVPSPPFNGTGVRQGWLADTGRGVNGLMQPCSPPPRDTGVWSRWLVGA